MTQRHHDRIKSEVGDMATSSLLDVLYGPDSAAIGIAARTTDQPFSALDLSGASLIVRAVARDELDRRIPVTV